jgi:hypothetical protein
MLEERPTNHDRTWTRPGIRAKWSGLILVALLFTPPALGIIDLLRIGNYGNGFSLLAIFGTAFAGLAWQRRRFGNSFTCSVEGIAVRTWYGRRFCVPWTGVGAATLTRRDGLTGLRTLKVRSPSGRLLAELPQDIGPLEEIGQAIEQRGS